MPPACPDPSGWQRALVARFPQFGVICRLAEGALCLLPQASDKDVKQEGSQDKPLQYLTCYRPPVYIYVL